MIKAKWMLSVLLLAAGCSSAASDDGTKPEPADPTGGNKCENVEGEPAKRCAVDTPPNENEDESPTSDPCAAIRIAPDGVCNADLRCDPDCTGADPEPEPEPELPDCSTVKVAFDGVCNPDQICDPDCTTQPEPEPEPEPEPNTPDCSFVKVASDGVCNPDQLCDPDCPKK